MALRGGSTGSFAAARRLIDVYVELCSAESDVEGQAFLKEHFEATVVQRGLADSLQEAFKAMAPAAGLDYRGSSVARSSPSRMPCWHACESLMPLGACKRLGLRRPL